MCGSMAQEIGVGDGINAAKQLTLRERESNLETGEMNLHYPSGPSLV